ncbi:hypothetical protein [Wenxinia saemankumensis]|uniref:Uncharacterized protein n=1 Tax=Wenxinia saemankumensis TaxID=1447782 RepID=A0A1M6HZ74_9RHOB|nr:hypothetical protein [Wenxinia saemankumensis]SHJ27482.1 hypothetical protein SAMN05444417_3437 [Wenxinia saemankumensis]
MIESMGRRIDALRLDLRGLNVVTEAATGSYACTAVLAALAGARVDATARATRHGTFEDAARATLDLARAAGVADRITIGRRIAPETLAACDILTNSGHLRPITAATISLLPARAVIALMFEAWEFRATDLDLEACRARAIPVAAVNERHPDVGVFPFLGPLLAAMLRDAGLALSGARVALVCDNPFRPFLERGLIEAGARPRTVDRIDRVAGPPDAEAPDAVVVALDPARSPPLDETALRRLAAPAPGALLAQFWGDIDREAARRAWPGPVWPPAAPAPGHMAVLLSDLGHEPMVRLQAGGLRAAELVRCGAALPADGIAELLCAPPRSPAIA